MRKKSALILITVLFMFGCHNPIKEANTYFKDKLNGTFSQEVNSFSSTVYFLYEDRTRYWYSEETTNQDILYDKFKEGFKDLSSLENDIQLLSTDDSKISASIQELLTQIKIAKEKIKETQNAIDSSNSLFSGIGGTSGLITFFSAIGSTEGKKRIGMPENVQIAYDDLDRSLIEKIRFFARKINEIENEAFFQINPTIEEKKEIRKNLLSLIRGEITTNCLNFNPSSASHLEIMIKDLFDYYEKEYKLSSGDKIGPDSYSGIPKECYKTIFFDDFSKLSTDYTFKVETMEYSNGYLSFEDGWVTQTINEISEKTNFEIEAKFRYSGGRIYMINSLVWGKKQDSEFAYGFCGSCNSSDEFRIIKEIEAKNTSSKKEYNILYEGSGLNKPRSEKVPEYSEEDQNRIMDRDNTLTIRNIDGILYFFYNGDFVYTTKAQAFFGNELGFHAGEASSMAVDYIKVSLLNYPKK